MALGGFQEGRVREVVQTCRHSVHGGDDVLQAFNLACNPSTTLGQPGPPVDLQTGVLRGAGWRRPRPEMTMAARIKTQPRVFGGVILVEHVEEIAVTDVELSAMST